jgi:hypothetical protein
MRLLADELTISPEPSESHVAPWNTLSLATTRRTFRDVDDHELGGEREATDLLQVRQPAVVGRPAEARSDRVKHVGHVVTGERPPAGQLLIQQHAEREYVGARIERAPESLLGRHVCRRPDDDTGAGRRQRLRALGRRTVVELGETEISQFGAATAAHEHVLRLDVAMKDSGGVRRRQSISDGDQ